MLSGRTRPSADRLAVIFRSVLPKAGLSEFGAFFDRQLPTIDYSEIAPLYTEYAPNRWPLNDRDRGTPRDATPPPPPGIRVTYHGGSTGLSLSRDMKSGKAE